MTGADEMGGSATVPPRGGIVAHIGLLFACGAASAAGVESGKIPHDYYAPLVLGAGLLLGLNKIVEAARILIEWRRRARDLWQAAVKQAVVDATQEQVTTLNRLIDGHNQLAASFGDLFCVRGKGLCDSEGVSAPTPVPRITVARKDPP